MRRFVRPALLLIVAALVGVAFAQQGSAPPKPFAGKVVSIADGDTITVLFEKTQYKIRMEHIDAPESGQDFGMKAKQVLGDKVFGKEVKIEWTGRDKYKRILGVVFLDGRNINLELVKEGYAWHYLQYSRDAAYAKAEKEAKEAKTGLWSMKATPPWDFRCGRGIVDPNERKEDRSTFIVYLTANGKKYQAGGCKFLVKSKIEARLGDVAKTYGPCSICKPPVLVK